MINFVLISYNDSLLIGHELKAVLNTKIYRSVEAGAERRGFTSKSVCSTCSNFSAQFALLRFYIK
jgi:hypothetical protein